MVGEAILLATAAAGIAAAVYAYLAFPAIAALLGAICPFSRAVIDRRSQRRTLTVIISAYNEEQSLEAKIRNALDTNHPRERLQVLVVSDASTDRTNEIARSFADDGVGLIVEPVRVGKSAGLNHAIEHARGDIVVFTDANALFTPDTIPNLLHYFTDPAVGLVTGYTQYVTRGSKDVATATNLYTSFERAIKIAESRYGSCVGADGAVFAMRRRLFRPLLHDDINDLVAALDVIAQGSECVFAAGAWCAEPTTQSVANEFTRQARITSLTLLALWRHLGLLNPFRFGMFSFFLLSHKVVRFLVPVLMMLSGAAAAVLISLKAPLLGAALGGAAVAVILAHVLWAPGTGPLRLIARPTRMVNIALAMQVAALKGWWHFLSRRPEAVWQHDRV